MSERIGADKDFKRFFPKETLSFEKIAHMTALEVDTRIRDFHHLAPTAVLSKIPVQESPRTPRWDDVYLKQLALMMMENVRNEDIADFFTTDLAKHNKRDIDVTIKDLHSTFTRYFTPAVKKRIQLCRKYYARREFLRPSSPTEEKLLQDIEKSTGLQRQTLFRIQFRNQNRAEGMFSRADILKSFLWRMQGADWEDIRDRLSGQGGSSREKEIGLLRVRISQLFSDAARAQLPQNAERRKAEHDKMSA
jgi:hypothetical protein